MLEVRRAVSNARHAVSVADRALNLDSCDLDYVEELIHSAEAELEEFLATTDSNY